MMREMAPLRVVAVAGLLLGLMACSKEEVVHGLTEFEANEIVYVLEAGSIKAQKEKEEGGRTVTYKVVVPGGEAHDARKVLVDNQLPRPKAMTLDKVYDPANKGLIPTATEEEAGYQMAVQGEIIQKLKTIPGVVEAHVTIVKPKKDLVRDMTEKAPPATAAITILYNQVEGRMPFKIDEVQRLVAGCVEGLDAANVTVLASQNRPTTKKMMLQAGEDEAAAGPSRDKAPKVLNIAVVDDSDKRKLTTLLTGGGAAIGVAVLATLLLLVGFMQTRRKLAQVTAEVTSLRKARAAPPPA